MTDAVQESRLLWQPSPEQIKASTLDHYQTWLEHHYGVPKTTYQALWQWSVDHVDDFWKSIWQYFDVQADGRIDPVLAERTMPGARWFPNASLNYAEHVFRNATDA
ncbi:MAG: acetoacetate--CoA ligase, partial [Alcaligenaceae bacterium]|nr:acetoacetate--CoA ligase [Alcaligenaceae bacterium]